MTTDPGSAREAPERGAVAHGRRRGVPSVRRRRLAGPERLVDLREEDRDREGRAAALEQGLGEAFTGPAAAVTGTLPLRRIGRLIDRLEAQTGSSAGAYTVSIEPEVRLAGRVGGQPIAASYAPALDLRLDGTRLAPPASADDESGDPLSPQRSGSITRTRPAQVSLPGLSVPRTSAIAWAIALLACTLGLALWLAWRVLAARRGPESGLIRMRMGHRLVRVAELPGHPAERVVHVAGIEDLILMAERAERPILAAEGGGPVRYALEEGNVLYRYDERPARPAEPVGAERRHATSEAG